MSVVQKIWQGWKRFGQFLGDVIGRVVLTVFYFTVFAPFGLGLRLFGDPLHIRPGRAPHWAERQTKDRTLQDVRRLS